MNTVEIEKKRPSLISVLRKNFDAFLSNNNARTLMLQQYGTYGAWRVFLHIPFFLQVNHPDIPGYVNADKVKCGIFGFSGSRFMEVARSSYAGLSTRLRPQIENPHPVVQSLLLMGSCGSVGHTDASDLDYWVCVDQSVFDPKELEIFKKKLSLISDWAIKKQSTEVHLYLINFEELVSNTLKPQEEKTEGEVAPLLLKDEFYRSFLWVTGRIPLWTVTPIGIDYEKYQRIQNNLSKGQNIISNKTKFIDMGFPLRPKPQEYLSAALWLSQKSEADPFKGVLKMILIYESVMSGFRTPLPCDLIKDGILNAREEDRPIDHYEKTILRVLDYAKRHFQPEYLELIRLSAYYKVRGLLRSGRHLKKSPKTRLLDRLVGEWEWEESKIEHFNNYLSWPDRERLTLGQEIKTMLFHLYSKISQKLMDDYPGEATADESSLAGLKAGILARYSDHEAKVELLPSSLDRKTLPKSMTLVYIGGEWALFGGRMETWQWDSESNNRRLIRAFPRAALAAAWLSHNKLYNNSLKLKILPRTGPALSLENMTGLLEKIIDIFPPVKYKTRKDDSTWRLGGLGPRLLIINFEAPYYENRLISGDLLYRTAWGEMRHFAMTFSYYSSEAEKLLILIDQLEKSGEIQPQDLHFYTPSGKIGRKVQQNIRVALAQSLGGKRKKTDHLTDTDLRIRLDTD